MTPREIEEYRALRATIRERGTTRVWLVVVGLGGWTALSVATAALVSLPVATLLPLVLLATVFEAVFALHTGVERIGRYLQVFYEQDGRGWEHQAMAFGQQPGPKGPDPLFTRQFLLATAANVIPAALAQPIPVEWAVVGALHVALVARVLVARRHAGQQRASDLERFTRLNAG